MRILVVSDSHHNTDALNRAIFSQPKAEVVIHLGDGADDIELIKNNYPEKMFVGVCGNCDFGSSLPVYETFKLGGKTFFATHGHMYNAKMDIYPMCLATREKKADILLFGHTHTPLETYDDGLHIMNPGSVSGIHGSYGIIDIEPNGIVKNIISVYKTGSHK